MRWKIIDRNDYAHEKVVLTAIMRCLRPGDDFHVMEVSWMLILIFDSMFREVELKFTPFMWMLSNRD